MRVCVVRHSTAVDPYEASSDETRWLTAAGRERARQVAALLGERLQPTHVFTSPLVRAVQTSEILATALGHAGHVQAAPALGPEGGTTAQALGVLDDLPRNARVLLVSHEPRVRILAGQLTGLDRIPSFRTGAVCAVDWRDPEGRFAFWIDPTSLKVVETLDDVFG
ncbi:MAG: histidine phosphatase family protein [Myxococcota bacterium]